MGHKLDTYWARAGSRWPQTLRFVGVWLETSAARLAASPEVRGCFVELCREISRSPRSVNGFRGSGVRVPSAPPIKGRTMRSGSGCVRASASPQFGASGRHRTASHVAGSLPAVMTFAWLTAAALLLLAIAAAAATQVEPLERPRRSGRTSVSATASCPWCCRSWDCGGFAAMGRRRTYLTGSHGPRPRSAVIT